MLGKILVSPIGTADPITMIGDGPMLHIVRHYNPDKVILLLTAKMAGYEDKDERYTRAIKDLSKLLKRPKPVIECLRLKTEQVHRYDLFIPEFEQCFAQLREQYPAVEIIVNISSGTPAMGQALSALHAFDRYNINALQVASPRRDVNQKDDREDQGKYDYEFMWRHNSTKVDNSENRCEIVKSQHFNELVLKNNIKMLLQNFDFVGAAALARSCATLNSNALELINGAVSRINLKNSASFSWPQATKYNPAETIYEYLSILEVYYSREQWADFLRAMTPALFASLKKYVNKYLEDNEWLVEKDNGNWLIVKDKVEKNTKLKEALKTLKYNVNYKNPGGYANLCSWQLIAVLDVYGCSDKDFKMFEALRKMEEVRNDYAHQIKMIDKNRIEKEAKLTFAEALDYLFELNGLKRGLYQKIAEEISSLL